MFTKTVKRSTKINKIVKFQNHAGAKVTISENHQTVLQELL